MGFLFALYCNKRAFRNTKYCNQSNLMKIINSIKIMLALITLTNLCYAQEKGNINGSILSVNGLKYESALVNLLQKDGKTLSKTALTDNQGNFEFSDVPFETYFVSITATGFQEYLSAAILLNEQNKTVNLTDIALIKNDANQLNEVVVTKKVAFVTQKADRTIVNPEALISTAGGTAMDVLSKSPGVIVDENGNIKLKGKSGVTIFIDDKPTYLTGTELENYLKSLSSSAIKQVEIMTNPPAQYEAAGNAGIINIRTKRTKLKGWNGSISSGYGQGKYAKTNQNANVNYNTSKLALSTNLSYSNADNFQDLTIERHFKNPDQSPESNFVQNTYLKGHREAFNARIGLDYYLSEKNTLGIIAKGVFTNSNLLKYNVGRVTDANNNLERTVIADNSEKVDFKNGAVTLNFRHDFDKPERRFTTDLDFVSYTTSIDQLYKNDIFLPDNTNIYNDRQNGDLPSTIQIYALKSDYTTPIKGEAKLDFGIKTSYTKTDNNAIYTITQNNVSEPNNDLSNHFLYNEMINAAYVNYSKSFKKWDIQAGLRFEDTQLEGEQLGNPVKPYSKFKNKYNSFFPTVFLNYKIDSLGTKTVNLNYGKRVNRPFYKDLNPFSSPLDQYTFYEGNPYLKPTFAHNVSLSYNYKELLSASVSYSYTKDDIKETIEINDGIYYSRPNNIGQINQLNFSVQSTFKPMKWLTSTVYTEFDLSKFRSQLYTERLDTNGTYWFIKATNSIAFSPKWSGEISWEYITESTDTQFTIGDFGHMSIGLQKKILNDMGSLRFNLSDVFYTNRIRGRINNLNLTDANWYGTRDTRVAMITFSYRFGKNTNKKSKYNGNGSSEEQGRVKV